MIFNGDVGGGGGSEWEVAAVDVAAIDVDTSQPQTFFSDSTGTTSVLRADVPMQFPLVFQSREISSMYELFQAVGANLDNIKYSATMISRPGEQWAATKGNMSTSNPRVYYYTDDQLPTTIPPFTLYIFAKFVN